MSTTDLTATDHRILTQLDELSPTAYAEGFTLAARQGASLTLLQGIAERFLSYDPADTFRVSGLPYIEVLLAEGWELSRVRQFVQSMFTTDSSLYHREGFLNSDEAWRICQTAAQFMEFMREMEPGKLLIPGVRTRLTAYMAELGGNANQQAHEIENLENKVAVELDYIETAHQFTIVLRAASRMGRREQIALANKFKATSWNLVLMGYMMAMHPGEHDQSGMLRSLLHKLDDCPWQGADMLRWLIMGYKLAFPEYWYEMLVHQSVVYQQFTRMGWHIVPVTVGPNGQVRATVPNKGQRITVVHLPGEPLGAGDRVIVSKQQLEKLTPRHTPGGHLYELSLTPATVPTDEQLSKPCKVFYADPHGKAGLRDMRSPRKTR